MMQDNWKQYLLQQAQLHPAMEPQDVYKLIFQSAYGAEHLLQDREAAYTYFQKEYEELIPEEESLYEQIQTNLYRVNLRAWKWRKLPAEWLFQMFVGSVEKSTKQSFISYVEVANEAVKEGAFAFSYEDFLQYTKEYEKKGPRAVHHSEGYRKAEKPAYRLVNRKYVRLIPVLEAMAQLTDKPVVLTIDGRCASGKSTMASLISEITGAGVVHMDDFFLPMELRTEERLAEPGGNVHYERFQQKVLPRLKTDGKFTYERFDCSRMRLGENREIADTAFRIVEGAYSNHPIFGDYADLKVFSDVESKEQLARIANRDGEEFLTMFKERWIPMEEKYFEAYRIREAADIIV